MSDEPTIQDVLNAITKLRTDLMTRMDRLQEQLTATVEAGFVNFAMIEKTRKNTEGNDEMLANFQRRLLEAGLKATAKKKGEPA